MKNPIINLVTSGETTSETTSDSFEFNRILALVESAIKARVSVIQLREKNLSGRMLYELAARAALLTRGTSTRLLVNDRADIARAAGCDGVHLRAESLEPRTIRQTFGSDFLVGVSAHTVSDARAARDGGADFAVLGPVFDTPSKRAYGVPLGIETLGEAARELAPFPILAIGGVASENVRDVLKAGASGVAAIRMFGDETKLQRTVNAIEDVFREVASPSVD